jgi:putative flippase GtrA
MKPIFKFMIVGGIGFTVNTIILYLLTENLKISYMISAIIAIQISVSIQFLLNSIYTFKFSPSFKRLILYESASLIGIILYYVIMIIFTEIFGVYYLISSLISTLLVFMFNYYNSKTFVWKVKPD